MNTQINNGHNHDQVITLHTPIAGSVTDIFPSRGKNIHVSFDLVDSSFTRDGDNLVLTTDTGGEIRLVDYFKGGEHELPAFTLADGSTVNGADLLHAIQPDLDISTAAGPDGNTSEGSGINAYASDSGSLVGGVDRLGALGTTQWSQSLERSENNTASNIGGGTPPSDAPSPLPPSPPTGRYQARAVLYKTDTDQDNTENNIVQFRLLNNGQPLDPSDTISDLAVSAENNYFKNFSFDPVTGLATFELSDEGLAALLAANGENLYDYITITYMVNGQLRTYTMQVVVNQDGNYNSSDEDAHNPPGNGSPDWGEWHNESKGSAHGNRTTSNGNDELWFSSKGTGDDAFHGHLDTKNGNNTVWFKGRVEGATVDMGNGNNKVSIASESHDKDWYGLQNSHITAGTGKNALHIANTNVAGGSSAGISAGSGSSIDFSRGHNGIINVTVDRGNAGGNAFGLYTSSSSNAVSLDVKNDVDGDIRINATSNAGKAYGAVVAANNNVTLQGGNITLNAQGRDLAQGVSVADKGSFTVNAAGTFTINARTTNPTSANTPTAFGIQASGGSARVNVNAKDVDINAASTHRGVYAASAYNGSTVNITGKENVSITATSDYSNQTNNGAYDAIGVLSTGGGKMTVTGSNINIKAVVHSPLGTATAVYGGNNGVTTVQGHNGTLNTINIYAKADQSAGIMATQDGKVYIKGGDRGNTINITGESAGNNTAWGVFGDVRGQSFITGGKGNDTLTIKAVNTGNGHAEAMAGYYGTAGWGNAAKHTVQGIENVTLEAIAMSSRGNATGMLSHAGGANTVKDANGKLTFSVKAETRGSGTAEAMNANGGQNVILGSSQAGRAADSFTVEAKSVSGTAVGMHSLNSGKNSINGGTSGKGTLNLSATTGEQGAATGLLAESGGKNEISNLGTVSINAQTLNGEATGMVARSNGNNSISNAYGPANVSVKAEAKGYGSASALWADGGKNTITGGSVSGQAGDTFTFDAKTTSGTATGMMTTNAGENKVMGGHSHQDTLHISATASTHGKAIGLSAENNGKNTITSVDTVSITAKSNAGETYGLKASSGGNNSITDASTVTINAHSQTNGAFGSYALNATNTIEAENLIYNVSGFASAPTLQPNVSHVAGVHTEAKGTGNATQKIVAGKDIQITVKSGKDSYGTYAANTGSGTAENILHSGRDIKITSESTGERAFGVASIGNGTTGGAKNTLEAKGLLQIDAKGSRGAQSISATKGGSNELRANDIKLTATESKSESEAVYSGTRSSNDIKAANGVTLEASGAGKTSGMRADGEQSTNTVTAGGNVSIKAVSTAREAYGLFADGTGALNNVTGNTVSIQSTGRGTQSQDSRAFGLFADNKGTNTVKGNDISIQVDATFQAIGLHNRRGGSNTVEGKKISITATSDRDAYGVYALESSSNTLKGENIFIVAKSKEYLGNSYGVSASNSTNTISSTEKVTISTHSLRGNEAIGLYSIGSTGANTINAADVSITAKLDSGSRVYALSASSNGTNTINATKDVSLFVRGHITGDAAALYASEKGTNTINSKNVKIDVQTTSWGRTYGLYARDATNTINADSVSINVAPGAFGYGVFAEKGTNTINAKDVSITANNVNGYIGYGLYATNSGTNAIINADKVLVQGGVGLHASSNGRNTISGKDVTIIGNHERGGLQAMYASSGGENKVSGDNLSISSQANKDVYHNTTSGVHAEDKGKNTVHGKKISIDVRTNEGTSKAVSANSGSSNEIQGENISIHAESASGFAYGLSAIDGINTISGKDSGNTNLTLTITATAQGAEKAIALWASGGGAVNYITGHSKAGGPGDSITINANNGKGIAMQTQLGGRNIITTGNGDDSVTINGAVKGNGNEINVGGGNNTVTLNGAVEPGSLNVHAGPNGTYTLILQAPNAQAFVSQYGAWLTALGSDALMASGLKSINFAGLDINALPPGFLEKFNDLLWALKKGGAAIQPPELADMLHDPAAPPTPHMAQANEEAVPAPASTQAEPEQQTQANAQTENYALAPALLAASFDNPEEHADVYGNAGGNKYTHNHPETLAGEPQLAEPTHPGVPIDEGDESTLIASGEAPPHREDNRVFSDMEEAENHQDAPADGATGDQETLLHQDGGEGLILVDDQSNNVLDDHSTLLDNLPGAEALGGEQLVIEGAATSDTQSMEALALDMLMVEQGNDMDALFFAHADMSAGEVSPLNIAHANGVDTLAASGENFMPLSNLVVMQSDAEYSPGIVTNDSPLMEMYIQHVTTG